MEKFIPRISILIPVYNVDKYIERCLESLFKNTIINECELIIVNDCSTDNSEKVINEFLGKFSNMKKEITLRSHDYNRGLAAARNTALLQAHGKYIICVDSDDWVEKDYLEKMYKAAEKDDADIVGCDYLREFAGHTEICRNPISENPEQALKDILSGKTLSFLWIKLFKRELFAKNNITWTEGLDITEDVIVCSRLFSKARKISYLNLPLYHYNLQNQTSLTSNLNEKKIAQIKKASELMEIEFTQNIDLKNAIRQRKVLSKMWILLCADKLKKEYLALWNDEKLYKTKDISLKRRLILWLCCFRLYWVVRVIVRISKHKKVS